MSFLSQNLLKKVIEFEQDGGSNSNFDLMSNLCAFSGKYFWRNLINSKPKASCLNVGLLFNGSLGDQVIQLQWARVFVQELAKQGCTFYSVLMFKQLALGQTLAQGLEHVDLIETHNFLETHKFDVLLSLDYFPVLLNCNPKAIDKYAPFLADKIKQSKSFYVQIAHMGLDFYQYQLMQYGLAKNWSRYDMLGQCGLCQFDRYSVPFLFVDREQALQTLDKYGLTNKRFIVLHTGVSDWFLRSDKSHQCVEKDLSHTSTYSLPLSKAKELVSLLKQETASDSELLTVQLGDPKGSEVDNVDLFLGSEIPLSEAIHVLSACQTYVGSDSDWLHIYHALNKRAIVLWGATSSAFSGYPSDINFQATCEPCVGLVSNWGSKCLKGGTCSLCMMEHNMDEVAVQIKSLI